MGLIERELAHNPARYTTVGGNRSRRPWRVKAAWATVLERERRSSMCRNSMEYEAAIEFMGYEEAVRCIGADLAHAASGDDPKMPWLIRDDGPITVREDGAHAKMVGVARPTAAAAVPRHATEKYRGGLKRTATWRPRPAEEDTDEEEQEVERIMERLRPMLALQDGRQGWAARLELEEIAGQNSRQGALARRQLAQVHKTRNRPSSSSEAEELE